MSGGGDPLQSCVSENHSNLDVPDRWVDLQMSGHLSQPARTVATNSLQFVVFEDFVDCMFTYGMQNLYKTLKNNSVT